MQSLLVGIALAIVAVGLLIACIPRGGKKAWFVGKPFIEPAASALLIGMFMVALILIINHFTTIDEFDYTGDV